MTQSYPRRILPFNIDANLMPQSRKAYDTFSDRIYFPKFAPAPKINYVQIPLFSHAPCMELFFSQSEKKGTLYTPGQRGVSINAKPK